MDMIWILYGDYMDIVEMLWGYNMIELTVFWE